MTTTDIKRQFFDSLKRGTGEAFILLNENPDIDFSKLIIKGAVRNYAYDRQAERSRADYIYRLIKNAKQKDKIVKSVLTRLQSEKEDDYGLDQMCDLAVMFFKAGYTTAKQALFNRFEKNILDDYTFCGTGALMEVAGMEGVLKAAELIGKILHEDPEDYESSWRIDDFQKRHKDIDVYKELAKAATKNEFIKIYYDSIQKNKWALPKGKKTKRYTYELIKKRMDEKKLPFISSKRNSELTADEVEKLADEFLAEKDNERKEMYLRFFSSLKFPYDYEPIFKLAKGRNPKNTWLVTFALKALKYFRSDELRAFALEQIKKRKNPEDYLILLVSNYKKEDYKLLTEVASRSNSYDFIHSIVSDFINIYEANPTKECKEPLELIYNKMNCGIHRRHIVRILIANDVLSQRTLKELEFDSDEGVRNLFQEKKNSTQLQ
ncbi:MAG TPA: hypothetical protein VL093_08200 [Flavipsychrobacter sp.]|nr:hypothetical protein [Flavipsychrobacter sp.]